VADTLHTPFLEGMDALVLKPAEMAHSTFAQQLPSELARVAAKGHYGDGNQLPGVWRICPEHAAAFASASSEGASDRPAAARRPQLRISTKTPPETACLESRHRRKHVRTQFDPYR
jgi:hypothetical protein